MASFEVWRAVDPDRPYVTEDHDPLAGEGASFASGRWHTRSPEKRLVYVSEHPALAYLEALAADPTIQRLWIYRIRVETPGVEEVPPELEAALRRRDVQATRSYGDAWYVDEKRPPVLRVPSVILSFAFNYVLRVRDPRLRARVTDRQEVEVDDRFRCSNEQ